MKLSYLSKPIQNRLNIFISYISDGILYRGASDIRSGCMGYFSRQKKSWYLISPLSFVSVSLTIPNFFWPLKSWILLLFVPNSVWLQSDHWFNNYFIIKKLPLKLSGSVGVCLSYLQHVMTTMHTSRDSKSFNWIFP